MCKNLPKILVVAATVLIAGLAQADKTVYVSKVSDGVYQISDPTDNSTVLVHDPVAYLKNKYYKKQEGFGKKITQKEFSQGTSAVAETASAVAAPVNYAANAAYNVANITPTWRKYTGPLRSLFGVGNTKKAPKPFTY